MIVLDKIKAFFKWCGKGIGFPKPETKGAEKKAAKPPETKAVDSLTYPEWMQTGKKTCLDYDKSRMEEILATHKTMPLTPGQEEDVERILDEARSYYRKKGLISEEEMITYRKSIKQSEI